MHRRCQHALQLTKAPSGHSAAGIAVIFDMVLTTHFMTLLMVTVWRKHLIFPAMFYTIFAAIELTYVSSAVRKVRSTFVANTRLLPDPQEPRPHRLSVQHFQLPHSPSRLARTVCRCQKAAGSP
jgi:K+ potassium transporter